MKVTTDKVSLSTKGNTDVIDITEKVSAAVEKSKVESGIATLFVIGSTAALTTIEFEPGLVHDIKVAFEKIAPAKGHYEHHERWGDDNGNSHICASLLGPSLTIPFNKGKLTLGTWQQIILIDFDTRGRQREVVVQIMGA
jgi:secondary thiamine-phosphate synthase enzyme